MDQTQAIRLLLDISKFLESSKDGSAALARMKESTDELDRSVKKAETDTYEFADTYDVLHDSVLESNVTIVQAAAKTRGLGIELNATTEAAHRLAGATGKAAGSTRDLGYAGLTAGRAIQDFAQGGLGGVLNNVEGLVMALGGTGGLAGILTAVGVAAFIAKPYVADWWKALTGIANDADGVVQSVEALSKALEKDKEALEKLHAQSFVSQHDLSEIARLTKEVAKQEAELAGARAAEAVRQTKGAEQKGRAKEFADILGDLGGKQVEDDVRKIITEMNVPGGVSKQFIDRAVKVTLANLQAGDSGTLEAIRNAITGGAGKGTMTAEALTFGSREDRQKKQDEADKERLKRADEGFKEGQKKAEADARLVDALNAQGLENQQLGAAARERDKKEDKATENARLRRGVSDIERQVNEQVGLIGRGSLDEQAATRAAQYRARGRGSAGDQQGALQQDISRELQTTRPDLNPINRAMVASKMAQQAMQKADAAIGEARQDAAQMMPALQGNLSVGEKNQRALSTTQQAMALAIQRLKQTETRADALDREAQRLMHAVSNQNNGGGMR